MNEQTTKDKLKVIGEWLYHNKEALRKDDLSVQYAVLSPDGQGGANVFGVYAINEENLWRVIYDTLKEFYDDNEDYDDFEDYINDVKEQFIEWHETESDDIINSMSMTYNPEDPETKELGDFFAEY